MSDFIGKEAARKLILGLKCSICQDVPSSVGVRKNRYASPKGNLVCEDCKGSKSFNGPLRFVENILENSQWHYCCHFKHGCHDMVGAQDLTDHQKCCIFREIVCIENRCKKQILFKDYIDHVDSDHKDWNKKATKVDEKTFMVSFSQEDISKNVLKFEVPNFTQLSEDMVYSEPIYVQNLPWKIGVKTVVEDSVKYLGCFVKCDCKSKSTTWSCRAEYEFRMINDEGTGRTFLQHPDDLFTSEDTLYGIYQYMEWKKVIQPEAGFLKNNTIKFELTIKAVSAKGLNPNFPKICDTITIGTPTMLKTNLATFLLASRKQCDTLRFWIYFLGSSLEAKHYISTLSITDETGKQKYVFQGEVFTLDKNDPHGGFLLSWNTTHKIP